MDEGSFIKTALSLYIYIQYALISIYLNYNYTYLNVCTAMHKDLNINIKNILLQISHI